MERRRWSSGDRVRRRLTTTLSGRLVATPGAVIRRTRLTAGHWRRGANRLDRLIDCSHRGPVAIRVRRRRCRGVQFLADVDYKAILITIFAYGVGLQHALLPLTTEPLGPWLPSVGRAR